MKSRTMAILASATGVALLAGVALYVTTAGVDDRFAECTAGQVGGGPEGIGGPFELVHESGAVVTDKDVITKPTLIYFGYTYCPDVCPLDTVRNAEAVDLLKERGYDVQPVFISVDWGRDDAQSMADFTYNIHPDMIGLTGSEEQIRAASKAYRTYFQIRDPEDEYYLIDHSTFTYLVVPEDGFLSFFRRELTADQMADQVSCYLDRM